MMILVHNAPHVLSKLDAVRILSLAPALWEKKIKEREFKEVSGRKSAGRKGYG